MTSDVEATVQSFVDDLPANERKELDKQLQVFCLRHASQHRPIVLVSSGGTAADLEVRAVRSLENFSTGLRGAISVEEFLRRGYAVVHLWRKGTASPFGRILSEVISSPAHQGVSVSALGRLFAGGTEEEEEDQYVQAVLAQSKEDPWLMDSSKPSSAPDSEEEGEVSLHRRIHHSSRLQTALQERHTALQQGRLLTVPFRSVEEYLAKLQLCSQSLSDSQSLALLFLAAAVSDFYVPKSQRAEHKIQSRDVGGDQGDGSLTVTLAPVPKVMGLIRSTWAPNAFVCSFKLETNSSILRQKAERAIREYGSHMVVGNLLETRYQQVWILAPPPSASAQHVPSVQDWHMQSIQRQAMDSTNPDNLEMQLVQAVVTAHFEYISQSDVGPNGGVAQAQIELDRKRRELQRELAWEQVRTTGMEWAGIAVGAILSYLVSSALRQRIQSSS
eukprot:Nitzschia sp. Nitz4//scaffold101_size76361//63422//64756//NITZ4_005612-RA/size76361-processed-gene-0.44-mRNA-1//-1//CDS//3329532188//2164//frame0